MKLDLTKPVVIFVGAWNPAIFKPEWIAHYLFGNEEAVEVPVTQVEQKTPLGKKEILFIDNVGISASKNRVEIYINDKNEGTITKAENAAINLINTLQHTPIGAFGINFYIIESDPSDHILDLLKSKDSIEQHFPIIQQAFESSITVTDAVVLNFTRTPSPQSIQFEFNYHHNKFSAKTFEDVMRGAISKYLAKNKQILSDLYNISGDYELSSFDLANPKEQANA